MEWSPAPDVWLFVPHRLLAGDKCPSVNHLVRGGRRLVAGDQWWRKNTNGKPAEDKHPQWVSCVGGGARCSGRSHGPMVNCSRQFVSTKIDISDQNSQSFVFKSKWRIFKDLPYIFYAICLLLHLVISLL